MHVCYGLQANCPLREIHACLLSVLHVINTLWHLGDVTQMYPVFTCLCVLLLSEELGAASDSGYIYVNSIWYNF